MKSTNKQAKLERAIIVALTIADDVGETLCGAHLSAALDVLTLREQSSDKAQLNVSIN